MLGGIRKAAYLNGCFCYIKLNRNVSRTQKQQQKARKKKRKLTGHRLAVAMIARPVWKNHPDFERIFQGTWLTGIWQQARGHATAGLARLVWKNHSNSGRIFQSTWLASSQQPSSGHDCGWVIISVFCTAEKLLIIFYLGHYSPGTSAQEGLAFDSKPQHGHPFTAKARCNGLRPNSSKHTLLVSDLAARLGHAKHSPKSDHSEQGDFDLLKPNPARHARI